MIELRSRKLMSDLSPEEQQQRRQEVRDGITQAAEMFTPLGDVQTVKDANKAFQEGRYLDAAGNAALIAAGYTPLGPLARPASRLVKNRQRLKGALHPMMRSDPAYRQEELTDYLNIARGKQGPLAGKSVGAATADTMADYTKTKGYNPLDLLLMQKRKIDPATHEIYYHGTTNPESARSIVEDRIRTPSHMVTGDPMVALQYTKTGLNEPYKGAIVGYPVKKGQMDKYRDPVPISNSRDPRAEGREQYNIPSLKLEDIMGDPFIVESPTQFKSNITDAINMLDDYHKSFMTK